MSGLGASVVTEKDAFGAWVNPAAHTKELVGTAMASF